MPEPLLIWIPLPLLGSGKLRTPWERMHWENLSAFAKLAWAWAPLGRVVAAAAGKAVVEVPLPRLATPVEGAAAAAGGQQAQTGEQYSGGYQARPLAPDGAHGAVLHPGR